MAGIGKPETVHPLRACLAGFFFVLAILSCKAAASEASGAAPLPLFNVGYQILDLKYRKDGQEQTLTVAVWYPTVAEPKPNTYGGPTKGSVAFGAAPRAEDGPYPFLVFSHGYGGSGLGSVFFTEALAARGWIVACPDHHDEQSAVRIRTGQRKDFDLLGFLKRAKEIAASGPGDRGKYLYRLDEMRLVLDGMLSSDQFGKLIDGNRIAVGGHSLGGFTALEVSGTVKERCDPRIRAVLLFSTGAGGYLFTEDELAAVRIPSMLFMGEREKNQMRGSRSMPELADRIFRNVSSPKYFLEVKGASHFSFNNRFAEDHGAGLLSGTEKQFDVIRRYSIAFLEKHVAGRPDSGHLLTRGDPLLTCYVTEPIVNRSRQDSAASDNCMYLAEPAAPADTNRPRRTVRRSPRKMT